MSTLALSSPAHAVDSWKCGKEQKKVFSTPGENVTVWIEPCIERSGSSSRASLKVSWLHGDGVVNDFDSFEVLARLEHNDSSKETTVCFLTGAINQNYSGYYPCNTKYASGTGKYTADGKAVYNINNDGEGQLPPWELTGSPVY